MTGDSSATSAPRQHLLFLESNTSGTGVMAMDVARRLGVEPVLLTSDPARYKGLERNPPELVICDTNSIPMTMASVRSRFASGQIAGITTTSEYYVASVAEMCRDLELPSNPPTTVKLLRNKGEMRRRFQAAPLRQPTFRVVTQIDEVEDAVREVGLPCVVKPVDDSGSHNVRLCRDVGEALELVEMIVSTRINVRGQRASDEVLIEQFVEGDEYSVETFHVEGRLVWTGVTSKIVTGDPYFVESGHLFPADLSPMARAELVQEVAMALDLAGFVHGPAHTEIKSSLDGFTLIEINPRLAGGMIPEIIRHSTGLDLLEQQLRLAAGMSLTWEETHAAHAGIRFVLPDQEGTVEAIAGISEARATGGVVTVALSVAAGDRIVPATNAYGRLGHVVATASSSGAVEEILGRAIAAIDVIARP